jgi:hypothetical protein
MKIKKKKLTLTCTDALSKAFVTPLALDKAGIRVSTKILRPRITIKNMKFPNPYSMFNQADDTIRRSSQHQGCLKNEVGCQNKPNPMIRRHIAPV